MNQESLNLVIVGHVDHGKSTIIGRLLADTGSLPEGKLEAVQGKCERHGKQFEYAFLLDALGDEQSQGITIDAARVFFKTSARQYIILDAPGHIEFLKNMVTGASHADAALLVIDADEGIQENSRRHGYMLSLLGIKSVAVLVNKMDLVGYESQAFENIVSEYSSFLDSIGIAPQSFIPVSGLMGDNIVEKSAAMPWFNGATVIETLDTLEAPKQPAQQSLRMYVQDVYKFTKYGDSRRIIAGTLDSGALSVGDDVVFYPSGKKSRVKSIESFGQQDIGECFNGSAAGFTLEEQIYVARGDLASKVEDTQPCVSTRMLASVFWLGKEPLVPEKEYTIKVGTSEVTGRLEEFTQVLDASSLQTLKNAESLERNNVAECILRLNRVGAFDTVDSFSATSRFVIVDDFRICGGGIIREALDDSQSWFREQVLQRNTKWINSLISARERSEKYNQKPALIIITGPKSSDRKGLAKVLEAKLFADGKLVYFLGIGSILYGLDADIKDRDDLPQEHVRRLAEVSNIMLDAGMLLLVTAADLSESDLSVIRTSLGRATIKSIWFGEEITTDIQCDLHLSESGDFPSNVERIKELLYDQGIIFRPW